MSKMETTSKVSLELPSRINLERPGARVELSTLDTSPWADPPPPPPPHTHTHTTERAKKALTHPKEHYEPEKDVPPHTPNNTAIYPEDAQKPEAPLKQQSMGTPGITPKEYEWTRSHVSYMEISKSCCH